MEDLGSAAPPAPILVSAIIPCHNGERYVAETILSVLRQDLGRAEIIVVDDGSTDGTRETVQAFGAVRYVHQPQGGAARARNLGVVHSTRPLLAFLDADDLWPEGALRALIAPLERDSSLGMTVGQMEQFVSPDLPPEDQARFHFPRRASLARLCGSVLLRRSEFDRVGGFSPALETGEFMDWILRAEALGVRSASVPDLVLRRRLHRLNHGVLRRDTRQDYLRVIKAALDRRRAAAEGAAGS
jgi:glycosyltransferase involved in cell wall biosynthesis